MSKIDEIVNKHVTIRRYTLAEVTNIVSAIEWMEKVRKLPKLKAEYISLEDTLNRNDEGNTSIQLSYDADKKEIYQEIKSREIDDFSIVGKYKDELVAIGVDLNNKNISICVRNKNRGDIEEIEELLRLND